ncbi:MAG: LCP family protein [Candidatus Gastranaerophilales bacterium]|nr:LCP family protein [Candidatus Gastranaerophilales bacterium]
MYNNKDNNIFRQPVKTKKTNNFAFIWSITTIIICILISFIILLAASASNIPIISDVSNFIQLKLNNVVGGVRLTPGLPFIGGKQNILLLGVDSNGDNTDPFKGTRSDTLMVLSIEPFSKSVNAISIPRDSKVYIADNHGLDKINSAHALGGPDLTMKTIKEMFGVKINHYVAVDYDCIKELVEAIGGIPVKVEKRMRYRDRAGHLNIDLYPGFQTLNAEEAVGYLRYRHDAIGDIGRMQRQQWFVRGLVKKLQSPEIIAKIPQLIQLASKYIRTDMNFYDLSQLALFAKSVDFADIQTATLPGKPSNHGKISYWLLEPDKTQEIIDRLIYRNEIPKKNNELTISLLYPKNYESKAEEMKTALTQAGYLVICSGTSKEAHTQILSHSSYATLSAAKTFRQILPEFKNAQFIISTDSYLCGESDFTLVMSDDLN